MIVPVKSLEIVLGGTSVDDVRKITIVGGNLVDDGNGNVTYTPPAGVTNHSALNQLDFASSGHTGFAGTEITNTFPQKQILSGDGTVLELILDGNQRGIRFQSNEFTYSELIGQLVNIGLGVLAPHVILRTTDNTTITSELLIGNGKIEATVGVFTGDGSGLTNLNVSLPANVAKKDENNSFSTPQTINGMIQSDLTTSGGSIHAYSMKFGGTEWRIKFGTGGVPGVRIGSSGAANDFWRAEWSSGQGNANTFSSPSEDPAQVPLVAEARNDQSVDSFQVKTNGGTILHAIAKNGAVKIRQLADVDAENSTLYDSLTNGKLSWKDAAGVVNPLY